MRVCALVVLAGVGIAVAQAPAWAQGKKPLRAGDSTLAWTAGTLEMKAYCYKPKSYDPKKGLLLIVLHGVKRNAEDYRGFAKPLADQVGALVVAPEFDAKRFPTAAYQHGNLLRGGKANPPAAWTWNKVPELVAEVRRREGRPAMPFALLGHSAGGQFLVRLAGFTPTKAVAVVAANPGTHLFPTREMAFPYGFGKLPDDLGDDAALRRYLAQPLVIYLGTADTERDKNLDTRAAADRQGKTRYARGQEAFRQARALARKKGWAFGWKLVEAPGVAHSAGKMFAAPACKKLFAALTK